MPKKNPGRVWAACQGPGHAGGMLVTAHIKTIPAGAWFRRLGSRLKEEPGRVVGPGSSLETRRPQAISSGRPEARPADHPGGMPSVGKSPMCTGWSTRGGGGMARLSQRERALGVGLPQGPHTRCLSQPGGTLMHSVTGRFHEQRASERPENALLPRCYPTPYYRSGRARIERARRAEIARQINIRRDASTQNRTAKPEFQDRSLEIIPGRSPRLWVKSWAALSGIRKTLNRSHNPSIWADTLSATGTIRPRSPRLLARPVRLVPPTFRRGTSGPRRRWTAAFGSLTGPFSPELCTLPI
jgi:hypothetical protein